MLLPSYKNILTASVAFIGGMVLLCSQTSESLAINQTNTYTPTDRPKPQRTQGGGSRGCVNSHPVSLKLLVPQDHTAFTANSHPTFSWYVSTVPSMPMEIALVEEGVAQPILVKRLTVKNSGLLQFKLPQEVSGLEVGKEYRWTVSLVCNPERPSQSIYARAWIQRKDVSLNLYKNILSKKSSYDKALAYIQAGIWYDAIASIAEPTSNSSEIRLASTLLQDLLRQVGIKEASEIKLL